jgi:hypothetical protein
MSGKWCTHLACAFVTTKLLSDEWGHCAQVVSKTCLDADKIIGNKTSFSSLPTRSQLDAKVAHSAFVCTVRPGKAEPCRIRMMVGGDKPHACQDIHSPAVGVTDAKVHLNSTILDAKHGACCCTGDLKDFFLVSEMKIFQCMRVHRRHVPQEVIDKHQLTSIRNVMFVSKSEKECTG